MLKFIKKLFWMDPVLTDAYKRTEALDAATSNGRDYFLICRPFVNHTTVDKIECEDKRIYIRQVPKTEFKPLSFGRRWDD